MTEASDLIEEFERLWTRTAPPDLEAFLSAAGEVDAIPLARLARIDQAMRWRRGERPLAEEYFARFPALQANDECAVDLIYHEYLVREQLREQPNIDELTSRFPRHATALAEQIHLHLALAGVFIGGDATSAAHAELTLPSTRARADRSLAGLEDPSEELRQLGRYRLLDRVGAGAFGVVYRAHDSDLDRIVAVKIPRDAELSGRGEIERFWREARSVAQLRHPSIVSVHEIGRFRGTPFLVSEFVVGTSLADVIATRRLAAAETAELVAALADALHYAHEMGVVHRDVKPANIMLDEQGAPRLMDFGLARRDAGDATMTMEGQVLGTPGYMSPEQARGESSRVNGRSDVYSLGVILYQLLTGEMPFRGTTPVLLHQLLHDEPKRPRALSRLVPRDLETICLKGMCKEPSGRYETARDMADDLRRFLKNEPIQARPVGGVERLWRWRRRNPALAGMTAAAAILLMALAVGGTFAALRFQQQAAHAEEDLYFSNIGFAHRDLTAGLANPGRAESLLEACPPERRNWEWDFLKGWRAEPRVLRAENNSEFRGIAFSPEGSRLAAASKDGKVRVWSLTTNELVTLPGHDAFVYSVAFHPVDENRLASSGNDGWVRVWDLKLRREAMPPLPGLTVYPVGMANCVTFSPDGQLLAAASEGGTVKIWDAATGELRRELEGHQSWAGSVAFHGDGRLLATGDWNGTVRIWDLRTDAAPKTLQAPEHQGKVASCIAFSPDSAGRYLAAGYFDNRVEVWDIASKKVFRRLRGHTGYITSVAFHPHDARRLASAGEDRAVRIWDVPAGREVLQLQGHIDICSGLAFRPDGDLLASASYDRTIRLWDATPLASNQRHELYTFPVASDVAWAVAISRDGNRLAAADMSGEVHIWNASTGHRLQKFSESFTAVVFNLAFSPDGQSIAAVGVDGDAFVLKVLDIETGEVVLEHSEGPEIFATDYSPDGNWLAIGVGDGSVKLLDAKTGREIIPLGRHVGQIAYGGVRFRPRDGLRLASACLDGTVNVWDLAKAVSAARRPGEPMAPPPHCRLSTGAAGIAMWSVSYSPDGARLVTGNKDGQLQLWDAENGTELDAPLDKRRHAASGAYLSTAYSPNGRWIVSASEDCTVRIYDAQTLALVHRFRGHLGPIHCMAVGDEIVVTGGRDKTVRVWDLRRLDQQNRDGKAPTSAR